MPRFLCLALATAILAIGQTTSNQPVFEVADVHASAPGTRSMDGGYMPGGRLELRGATMLDLITSLYEVEPDHVFGGPTWLNTDRFDVIAKAPARVTEPMLQAMAKALLADRFKLVVREENRDAPVFILTANKKALKLQRAADKSAHPNVGRGEGDPALNMHIKYTAFTMAALAESLRQQARNFVPYPVLDETHLDGSYDFQLDWMGINIYRAAKSNPDGPPAVGVFDALEKVGLHLEEGRRPQPVLVVESVNRTPTPNAEGAAAAIPAFPTEFDVAEVHPARPVAPSAGRGGVAGPTSSIQFENGRIEFRNETLKDLIVFALGVDPRMVIGGPKWAGEDRFDVIAKTARDVPELSVQTMMKGLLAERFQLKTHTEEQPMPVYVLLPGKKPNLKPSDGTARSDCKIVQADQRYFVCEDVTLAQFAERLPNYAAAYVHPPVLDLTGLPGTYDIRIYWTPRGLLQTPGRGGGEASAQASTPVVELTLFEALDKQLGLKLEEQKRPVPVTVIDSAEKLK